MSRKKDFSKYLKQDLVVISEKMDLEIKKLKKNEKIYEKHMDLKEKRIKELEKEKIEWFEIEKNAETYANYKQMVRLERQLEEYKKLYEKQREVNQEDREKYRKKLENTKENEYKAGRKKISQEIVLAVNNLYNEQPKLSNRKASEILKNQGLIVSHTKINQILKENVNK